MKYLLKRDLLPFCPLPNMIKKSTFIFSTKNKISKQKLKSLLSSNFNISHGSINLLPSISNFDLAPHLSKTVNDNFILIGDTMRSIHPVAGQGWNLGIKDIQTPVPY